MRITDAVGVGDAELAVEAALDVGEGVAGADERQEHVVHRRVVAPPARIRGRHDLFGKGGISSSSSGRRLLAPCGFELGMEGKGTSGKRKAPWFLFQCGAV